MGCAIARARVAAVAAAAMAGLLLAAGCSPAGPPSGGLATTGITFATGVDDSGFFNALIRPWNEMHPPDQQVRLLRLPQQANDQLAQLTANLQARSSQYDVIDMDVVWTAEFASAGWIVPLESKMFPQLNDFLQPAVNTAMYDGHLWAVPYYSNADLLYYRKDILAKAHKQPPKTWAQLEDLAKTVAPRYGLQGYAGQLSQYEGLTVNFADAVQSAGGSILSPGTNAVTVTSPQAEKGLDFLVDGLRDGWITKYSLTYDENSSAADFESGKLLFLNNWPYVYSQACQPESASKVCGKVGVALLPGLKGTGSSSLGGANLAVSAYSQHQQTALAFIRYLTSRDEERKLLVDSGFPPVWTRIYSEPAMLKRFPYLPVLENAIQNAKPRPSIANYDQASLAISSAVYQALIGHVKPPAALAEMAGQLTQIIRDG